MNLHPEDLPVKPEVCNEVNQGNLSSFNKWFGIDADVATSLGEYGLILRNSLNKVDYLDQPLLLPYAYDYIFCHRDGENLENCTFEVGGIDEEFVDEKFQDLIVERDKCREFADFIGLGNLDSKEVFQSRFLTSPISTKINDLLSYFSYDDIFGSLRTHTSYSELKNMRCFVGLEELL